MRALLGLVCLVLTPGAVRADVVDDVVGGEVAELVETVARRALARSRRSLTLGPSVAVAPGLAVDDGEADIQLSVGLGLQRYDIPPLPSMSRVKEIVLERVRARYGERLALGVSGLAPIDPEGRKELVREIWREVAEELLLEVRPRRLEKPSFQVMLELLHTASAGGWDLRATAGLGVGPVFAAVGAALQYEDGAALAVPLEVSLPVLLGDGLRSPVVDAFVRYELAASDRDERSDRVFAGARFLLDLI